MMLAGKLLYQLFLLKTGTGTSLQLAMEKLNIGAKRGMSGALRRGASSPFWAPA